MKPRRKNQFIIKDGVCQIPLYKGMSCEVIAIAKVSAEDYEKVNSIFWTLQNKGYCRGYDKNTRKMVLLHKTITGTNSAVLIDHINRNKLDCRRENLRLADKRINSLNRDVCKANSTGVTGVSFDATKNKYRAYGKERGRQVWLGYYQTLEEAASARNRYLLRAMKEDTA